LGGAAAVMGRTGAAGLAGAGLALGGASIGADLLGGDHLHVARSAGIAAAGHQPGQFGLRQAGELQHRVLVALEGHQAHLAALAAGEQRGLQLDGQGLHLLGIQRLGLGVGQHEGQGGDHAVAARMLPAMLQIKIGRRLDMGGGHAGGRRLRGGKQDTQAGNGRHGRQFDRQCLAKSLRDKDNGGFLCIV